MREWVQVENVQRIPILSKLQTTHETEPPVLWGIVLAADSSGRYVVTTNCWMNDPSGTARNTVSDENWTTFCLVFRGNTEEGYDIGIQGANKSHSVRHRCIDRVKSFLREGIDIFHPANTYDLGWSSATYRNLMIFDYAVSEEQMLIFHDQPDKARPMHHLLSGKNPLSDVGWNGEGVKVEVLSDT